MNVITPGYFDQLYAADPDPWRFSTSGYERAKYLVTLAALPARRFVSGLEVGCSIGVLTRMLAAQCDQLLGVDVSAAPLAQARRNCADLRHVSFRQARIPDEWPAGCFDLIVLSEVLYFLAPAQIADTARRLEGCLLPGAAVVAVNWLGETDTECDGDAAAALMIEATRGRLTRRFHLRMPRYRVDVFTAAP